MTWADEHGVVHDCFVLSGPRPIVEGLFFLRRAGTVRYQSYCGIVLSEASNDDVAVTCLECLDVESR